MEKPPRSFRMAIFRIRNGQNSGIEYYEHEFEEECLDGFEYFPDLKELDISCAEKVVLRNCPSLVKVSGKEGHIGTLIIEDCPVLERMYFFDFWMDTLCITGAPALELETDRLYFQTVEDYVQTLGVEWVNTGEKIAPLGEEAVRECVEKGKLDFFDFLLNSPYYMVLAPCNKNINRENINSLFSTTLINKSGFVMVSNFQELQSVSIQYRCIMSCLLGGLNS